MIQPITSQDLEDAANMFLMSVNAYIGFDKTGMEVAGAAHTILSIAIQNLNKQHEQTTGIRESEGSAGDSLGSGQVPEDGTEGRIEESSEGNGQDAQSEASRDDSEEPSDSDRERLN